MNQLKLGAFSVSLNVKDIQASKSFYEKLGFSEFAGDISQNWLILKNGNAIIGLFQGMFEKNMLTFNPGWDENAKDVDPFDDIRSIYRHLKENGIEPQNKVDETHQGPASMMITDPDGNPILIDQHR
ncbi:VOC family protein [Lunatibacter salilacus]|uniref:VOC family protein n=1 Tax=Lunatibacter salilacus TaxID=2483804 RepID=UPI00131D547F|nr:VOC family protein [Lunatibacter salilacus]